MIQHPALSYTPCTNVSHLDSELNSLQVITGSLAEEKVVRQAILHENTTRTYFALVSNSAPRLAGVLFST